MGKAARDMHYFLFKARQGEKLKHDEKEYAAWRLAIVATVFANQLDDQAFEGLIQWLHLVRDIGEEEAASTLQK